MSQGSYLVAVVGAGPAGLFASRQLASAGAQVVLLNRDIKPGGLAEYGIYYDKHKMKEGLRKQFRKILEIPQIEYLGNVSIGEDTGLSLDDLRKMGFQAILVTVGAQGTKLLGIPGEDLSGVYHAKDIVYHYNSLPPFSQQEFAVCCKVALIGVGNVMLDIAHWLIRDVKVDEVIAVARRGPAEVKFSKNEMEIVANNLDLEMLDKELARVTPVMEAVGQNVQSAREYILSAMPKALEPVSDTIFAFDFLASPTRIVGDAKGNVVGLEVEDTTLVMGELEPKARGLGTHRILDVDAVVFCIGDRVDETFGLPVQRNEFVKSPTPHFSVDGLSYEAYDPQMGDSIPGVFVAGWSRKASSGLVGIARKDGENGAKAVQTYLETQKPLPDPQEVLEQLHQQLDESGSQVVLKDDVFRLELIESQKAQQLGLDQYKMKSNEEMLAALNEG